MTKPVLSISPYRYKSGYSCYALHMGNKPSQENNILESSRIETVQKAKESLEGKHE